MKEIITKLLNWVLPERGLRRYILDELRQEVERLNEVIKKDSAEYEKLEGRIQKLEVRFAKESCLRFACKHRLSIDQLPTTESCSQGKSYPSSDDKNGAGMEV